MLGYIKPTEVRAAWAHLQAKHARPIERYNALANFITYFNNEWMSSEQKLLSWNVSHNPEHMTNNDLEAANSVCDK